MQQLPFIRGNVISRVKKYEKRVSVRGRWSLSLRRGFCLLCFRVGGGFPKDCGFCAMVSEVAVRELDFLLVSVHAC